MWNDNMDCGHYLAGRRESILFDERGLAVQCAPCNRGACSHVNRYHGSQVKERVTIWFTIHMVETQGREVIEELFQKKDQDSRTYSLDELWEMIQEYEARIEVAKRERGLV